MVTQITDGASIKCPLSSKGGGHSQPPSQPRPSSYCPADCLATTCLLPQLSAKHAPAHCCISRSISARHLPLVPGIDFQSILFLARPQFPVPPVSQCVKPPSSPCSPRSLRSLPSKISPLTPTLSTPPPEVSLGVPCAPSLYTKTNGYDQPSGAMPSSTAVESSAAVRPRSTTVLRYVYTLLGSSAWATG